MRIIIIGAVAGGTSAAAKARRNNEKAEIVVYEKDAHISYSGCGMPFFLGDLVLEESALEPRDPQYFKERYNIDILIQHEVLSIDTQTKSVQVRDLKTQREFADHYDELILSTGARASVPPIPGATLPHVFTLRTIGDMQRIKQYIKKNHPQKAVIIGTGFIGLELCENFHRLGIKITLIEKMTQVSPTLDEEMSLYVEDVLVQNGVQVLLDQTIQEITPAAVVMKAGIAEADLVILSTGVKPNVELAKAIGITLGSSGAISVNSRMETSVPHILACGDCIEQMHQITKKSVYRPLGSTANKTGRIAGENAAGGNMEFRGVLGTAIYQIFGTTVAQTGLTEKEAQAAGIEVIASYNIKPHRPEYLGGKEIVIKTLADPKTGKILGAQIIGPEGVDKRIDVMATAISFGATAEDLMHLDLAYAPPYATTKDPILYSGMILENAIHRGRRIMQAGELTTLMQSGQPYTLIDTRIPSQYQQGHIPTAVNIPHEDLRSRMAKLDQGHTIITYCNKGVTGNAAQNILLNAGFPNVFNLAGGYRTYRMYTRIQARKK